MLFKMFPKNNMLHNILTNILISGVESN